jgi:DNA-binding response OmpR family regulator
LKGSILIVEDDPVLLRGLRDTFARQGWEVETAAEGEAALNLACSRTFDLILLDIMLPRVNGYEICRAVRERGCQSAILILTAKSQEEDVILGLNLGADDYLGKPFRRGELLARANALVRRARRDRTPVSQFGEFTLDVSGRRLLRNGTAIELTGKEFGVLAYLASRPGCAVTREQILDAVWGTSVIVTPRSVDRCMATLRTKIENDPHHPGFLHTIREIGYRFEPETES